jgi:pyruvate kinase
MSKKVKIIATIGPASRDYNTLKNLSKSGVSIIRINTKYGSEEEYLKDIKNIRKIKSLEIMFDIKSLKLIPFIKKLNFEYLAVSFAESKEQIKKIKNLLSNKKIKIVSKIETKKGIKNLDQLIKESNGIMVARGDLGKNIPMEKLPIFQKIIIKKCNKRKKIAITATEMLLSMTKSKTPERAEVSDVANAVLDGSDMLMLSEETAIGKYPIQAANLMKKIICATNSTK